MAEAAGLTCQVGSMVETAIGTAAGAHLSCARQVIKSNEMVGPLMLSRDVAKISIHQDELTLSDKPGLGIDVEEDVLEELAIRKIQIASHSN